MKKIILMVIAMVMTLGVSNLSAATKGNDIKKTQFITDIDCEKCIQKIMNYIPNQKGVKDVDVDIRSKIVTVVYDADKTKEATLIKKFNKIDIKAKVYDPKDNKATTSPTPNRTETTQNQNQNQNQSIQKDQRNK
ncbi:MAG: heavy-metal-associated domain-containing protein [Rikenellaceae bacterium]